MAHSPKQMAKSTQQKQGNHFMTDDNMDHNNQNFNNSYKISNIKEITHKFLKNNNYTIHNETNTYHIN